MSVCFSLYLMLLMVSKMECALVKTEDFSRHESRNALEFISDLRDRSNISRYAAVKFPRLDLYIPTSNFAVNQAMEKEYVAFWNHIRQHANYVAYVTWLVGKSKGAALALQYHAAKKTDQRGLAEARLLKPIFKGDHMSKLFIECLYSQTGDIMKCLKGVMETNILNPVEREISLTAHWLLDFAMNATADTTYPLSERDLKLLRSADEESLKCIRNWDRIYSIPRTLYLSMSLQARQLIAHLMNDQEESDRLSEMEELLDNILITEFSSNMIREVKRAKIDAGGSVIFTEGKKKTLRTVREIRLLLVRQALKRVCSQSIYLDITNSVLYISMNEDWYRNDGIVFDALIDAFKQDVLKGRLTMPNNPTLFSLTA